MGCCRGDSHHEAAPGEIRISAAPTRDPATFRFTVNRPIFKNQGVYYESPDEAAESPIGHALFELDGVTAVAITDNVIDVTAATSGHWPELAHQVGRATREALLQMPEEEEPVLDFRAPRTEDEEELLKEVQLCLDSELNPMIAMHGGYAELVDVRGNRAFVKMHGGCQGCGAADVTLKQGIARMITERFGEIKEVLDITDHASGVNPYYAPSH